MAQDAADRWKFIGASAADQAVYIDTETISRSGEGVTAWVRYINTGELPVKNGRAEQFSIERVEYLCVQMRSGTLSSISYASAGEAISTWSVDTPKFIAVVPDTVGEVIWKALCR